MGFNMKDLQKMQAQMMKMQDDLQNSVFEGASGGGAVTMTINGKFEVTAVKLNPEAVDPEDVSMLEDLILTAFQDAYGKVTEAQAKMMQAMTGGMKLPPGMGF
ncbi:MAG TPA: YbaB/EbfC family nucleoid-associated protein [Ktedonobacterales bacterium]|jgi:DNA-binding YbaB/EbfC family protein|nr:YbaB/EbfC family nucleoid-associated protein [Ktedonobacterales bacterium]